MAETVRTPQGILSFPNFFTPKPRAEGRDPEFSGALLFDAEAQSSPEFKAMKKAVVDCAEAKWPGKARDMLKGGQLRLPFKNASEKDYDGYEDGMVYINPWSKEKPGIVDRRLQEVLNPGEVWAGKIARMTVAPFAYDNSGNRGVSFYLNNVQVIADGDKRLDGKVAANKDFDALDPEETDGADSTDPDDPDDLF